MTQPNFRALCAEIYQEFSSLYCDMSACVDFNDSYMERIDNLSRAYRVNLTVLALVALFTGGFLVFSVLALSVTRRAQPLGAWGIR